MLSGVVHTNSLGCSTRARTLKWKSLPPLRGCTLSVATALGPTSIGRDNHCGNFQCQLSTLELPLDSLIFCLDVGLGSKSAAHYCTAVNGMMTRGVGNRIKLQIMIQCTMSFFDSTLSKFSFLQREFSITHAWVQIDRWSLKETFHPQFCRPDIPDSLSACFYDVREVVDIDSCSKTAPFP